MHDTIYDFVEAMRLSERDDDRYDDKTAVYRYFSDCGHLLYAGISNQPIERHKNHIAKPWVRFAGYMRISYYPLRSIAEYVESCAILNENAYYNQHVRLSTKFPGRAKWYLEKMGGDLRGEGVSWFDVLDWMDPEGCDQPDFWTDEFTQSEKRPYHLDYYAQLVDRMKARFANSPSGER